MRGLLIRLRTIPFNAFLLVMLGVVAMTLSALQFVRFVTNGTKIERLCFPRLAFPNPFCKNFTSFSPVRPKAKLLALLALATLAKLTFCKAPTGKHGGPKIIPGRLAHVAAILAFVAFALAALAAVAVAALLAFGFSFIVLWPRWRLRWRRLRERLAALANAPLARYCNVCWLISDEWSLRISNGCGDW